MDERTSLPVTLPRPNPTISGWQDPPDAIADLRTSAELPQTADVVVIGSGISGASIALGLLESGKAGSVVMLEARQACSGATGRNGGHTKGSSYRSFLDNIEAVGADNAIKIARLEYNNIKAVHAFIRLHNIDCDLFTGDTVDIIYDQDQWDTAVRSISLMRKLMPHDLSGAAYYTFHTAAEARERFHCKGDTPIGALSYAAGSLVAYKFVIAILRLCLSAGLNLQTSTPATALSRAPNGHWTINTPRGTITAPRLVLATNGYTAHLLPSFHKVIVPLRGQITAHRPGLSMPTSGLQTTYSFIYATGYEYMISRPADSKFPGDIIIGGGLVKAAEEGLFEYGTTDDTVLEPDIHNYLVETTPRYFGDSWGEDHPDGRIRAEWTGIMGYSPDGFPFVGEIPGQEGLFISASFQGHGMVLCFLCAKALVHMMLHQRSSGDGGGEGGGESGENGKAEEEGDGLEGWFPAVYRISEERMRKRFRGRLHTKVEKKEGE